MDLLFFFWESKHQQDVLISINKCLIQHRAYSEQHSRPPSIKAKTLRASQQCTQVIHSGHTSKSSGFSVNVSSWFNACEILYWQRYNILIYMRRQFCKYLAIFVFIIRDIYFLVSLCVFPWPVVCTAFLIHLSLSGLEDKCAVSFVLLEIKTSKAASQVPKGNMGCCVCYM